MKQLVFKEGTIEKFEIANIFDHQQGAADSVLIYSNTPYDGHVVVYEEVDEVHTGFYFNGAWDGEVTTEYGQSDTMTSAVQKYAEGKPIGYPAYTWADGKVGELTFDNKNRHVMALVDNVPHGPVVSYSYYNEIDNLWSCYELINDVRVGFSTFYNENAELSAMGYDFDKNLNFAEKEADSIDAQLDYIFNQNVWELVEKARVNFDAAFEEGAWLKLDVELQNETIAHEAVDELNNLYCLRSGESDDDKRVFYRFPNYDFKVLPPA